MAQAVHQVGGVLAVQQRERRIEADLGGVLAEEAVRDRVERPRPGQRGVGGRGPPRADDPQGAAGHLLRRAPREREQEDPPRVRAAPDQRRHPVR